MKAKTEAGQSIALVALFMVVLLGMTALTIDGGSYLLQRRDMQGDADAAALAAVRELPSSTVTAAAVASDYVQVKNSADNAELESIEFLQNNTLVRVTAKTSGRNVFSRILGQDAPTVAASAAAKVRMAGSARGMLPMAFMRNSYTIGENTEVKFDGSAGGNHGPITPEIPSSCTAVSGASDFRDLIIGAAAGGLDACATPLGGVLDTETGNMSGPARQGFADRLDGDSDALDDVFEVDGVTGKYILKKPESKRIGIVPVIEQPNGSTEWPSGRKPIRIVSYVLVYIGKTDVNGYPPVTANGKSVWVTPLDTILPSEFSLFENDYIDYDPTLDAPVVFELVE